MSVSMRTKGIYADRRIGIKRHLTPNQTNSFHRNIAQLRQFLVHSPNRVRGSNSNLIHFTNASAHGNLDLTLLITRRLNALGIQGLRQGGGDGVVV
jgi:hypothetical protein